MDGKKCNATGTTVERGRIAEIANGGGYRVENLDRPGLVSRVITGTGGVEYNVDDCVLFVMFKDGTGKILCKA